ncbi:hypothetical protein HDU78_008652 [Chytriomyces hyalinus]|nr:hypothetical protein HDU78_008652 [Chytriomyces hyalinus]
MNIQWPVAILASHLRHVPKLHRLMRSQCVAESIDPFIRQVHIPIIAFATSQTPTIAFANRAALSLLRCPDDAQQAIVGQPVSHFIKMQHLTDSDAFNADLDAKLAPLRVQDAKLRESIDASNVLLWQVDDPATGKALGKAVAFPHVQVTLNRD